MTKLREEARHALDQHVVVSPEDTNRFIKYLVLCVREREKASIKCATIRHKDNIFGLVHLARESHDLDEAVWRCFLAAHFGVHILCDDEEQIHSAFMLLCAFGVEPYWTWRRLYKTPNDFRMWLLNHADDLKSLSFGNHRKYESKQPNGIWEVVESFLNLADQYGGPRGLISTDPSEPDARKRFDSLYHRFRKLRRFGRTGAFDFMGLLIDLNLIDAEPASCYLEGATGPLDGAKKLWGNLSVEELDNVAAELAKRLGISPMALEDALCRWQK